MNEPSDRVSDDELYALVDGQLDAGRLPSVLAWLQANPDDAARVAQWQAQRLQLREQLQALVSPDVEEDEAVRRWKKIGELVPNTRGAAGRILERLATELVLRQAGL